MENISKIKALYRKQKKTMLITSQYNNKLSRIQLWNLFWWGIFKPWKSDKFYEMIFKGKAARFAYKDALNCKQE